MATRPTLLHVCGRYLPLSETFTYDLINGLDSFRHHVVASGIENLQHFPLANVSVPEPEERAWELAKAIDARAIVCHFGPQATMGMPIGLAVDQPVVTIFHGYDVSRLLREKRWIERYRAVAALGMQALCISNAGRDRLLAIGWPARQIHVVRLGVDTQRFAFRPPAVRWSARGPRRILMVSRLVEKKGVHIALEAMRKLNDRGLALELRVIGEGPERQRLESIIAATGLTNVRLLGAQAHEATRQEFADADLYIQPSVTAESGDQEGIPVSLMEAQASGLPVVSTRHSGIPELVLDGATGWLTDEGDAEGLAGAIERLACDAEQAQRFAQAGREHIRKEFDRNTQARRFASYLEGLIGSRELRPSVFVTARPRPRRRGLLIRSIPVGLMGRKLSLLAHRYPDIEWEVLTSRSSVSAVQAMPLVRRVWPYDDGRLTLRSIGRDTLRQLQAACFGVVIVPYRNEDGAELAHVRRVGQVIAPKGIIALTLRDKEARSLQVGQRPILESQSPAQPHTRRTFFCPCCQREAGAFLPFGIPPRPKARCPHCGSVERHRLLWMFLASQPALLQGRRRLLHIAPEPVLAGLLKTLDGVQYVSGDLSLETDVRLDITALPFASGSIDAVICNHVLEHVPDDGAAMREFRRILSPGGWAILQSPIDGKRSSTYEDPSITDPSAREKAFGQFDHVRIYGQDYYTRLAGAGFTVERVPFAEGFDRDDRRRYALRREDIVLCRPAA